MKPGDLIYRFVREVLRTYQVTAVLDDRLIQCLWIEPKSTVVGSGSGRAIQTLDRSLFHASRLEAIERKIAHQRWKLADLEIQVEEVKSFLNELNAMRLEAARNFRANGPG